jgi:Bifunctional DNA primase/polymerase, N-terminal
MLEDRIKEVAEKFIAAGFWVIPLYQDSNLVTKRPMQAWKVGEAARVVQWDFQEANIAMLTGGETNGYIVVDCDSKEAYKGWLATRTRTPLRVRSRRGMHFYYRHPGTYVKSDSHIKAPEGFEYDIKGDRSYVVMPPSISKGHQYQVCICTGNLDGKWISASKLPVFDPSWRPERPFRTITQHPEGIKDVRKYLSRIDAGEGERDKQTFRAAKICIENNVPEADAIHLVTEWHQLYVHPPWEPMEIIEKVRRVYGSHR